MRTTPEGWRWTMVASNTSARMTKSRSEPAGRSKSTHSLSASSSQRSSQLDSPLMKRRDAARVGWRKGVREICRSVPAAQVAGSDLGSRMVPLLAARRSCTVGLRAWSTSSSSIDRKASLPSAGRPLSSNSSASRCRRRVSVWTITPATLDLGMPIRYLEPAPPLRANPPQLITPRWTASAACSVFRSSRPPWRGTRRCWAG
jgi:hypothetical protein